MIKKHEVTITWGTEAVRGIEEPIEGYTKIKYKFNTESELNAFIKGVDEGNGWLEYEVEDEENNCKDCEGLGYYTEVISTGLSDPNDPYHYPHTERCDTCKVFDSDEQADKFVKSIKHK